MHSPTFPGTFSSNYFVYICVDKLQKYLFQYERFKTFWQMQFSLSLSETIKGLVFHLLLFAETLLCKLGVWGPLRAPEAVTLLNVKYAFSPFSWDLFFKSLTYIYVGTYTKYLFQCKASGYFDKFVLQNWFSLQIH